MESEVDIDEKKYTVYFGEWVEYDQRIPLPIAKQFLRFWLKNVLKKLGVKKKPEIEWIKKKKGKVYTMNTIGLKFCLEMDYPYNYLDYEVKKYALG